MNKKNSKKLIGSKYIFLYLLASINLFAESLPWESPIKNISNSITGNVATWVITAGVAVTGISFMFGDGGMGQKAIKAIIAGVIAMSAGTIVGLLSN